MRDLIDSCCTCDEERTFVAMREAGYTLAEIAAAINRSRVVHLQNGKGAGCPRPAQAGGHTRRMIRRIFLDLDDVCNTLAPFVLHSVGCDIGPTDYAHYPRKFGYAISDVANHLLGEPRYTPATLWASIPRAIWVKVPESPFFSWLLEACAEAVGRENVCIATSPTKCPESLAGKLEWIHDHFPEWMHRQYAITPRKHLFARPDSS